MRGVELKIVLAGSVVLGMTIASAILMMPSEFRSNIYPKIEQYNEKLEDINFRISQLDMKIETTNREIKKLGTAYEGFIENYKKAYNRIGNLEEIEVKRRRRSERRANPDFLGTQFKSSGVK